MEIACRLAADVVVVVHLAYVAFVVLGLPGIFIGYLRGHRWIRNFRLRALHLAMILIVVCEAWAGVTCPLTTWENNLRKTAGQQTYQGAFLANAIHDLLFYDAPAWIFVLIYSVFGLLVAVSFILVPPDLQSEAKAEGKSDLE